MALDAFESCWMMMMMMMVVPVPGDDGDDAYSKHLKTMSEPQTIRKFACFAVLCVSDPTCSRPMEARRGFARC